MPSRHRLNAAEREFFGLLADIIFSNPFRVDRARLERVPGAAEAAVGHQFGRVIPALGERLRTLEARGIRDIAAVQGNDREQLSYAYLFATYHRHASDFDALIGRQLEAGDEPVAAGFARDLLGELAGRGFTAADALRYFELFYQLRRAFTFIAHGLVGDSPSMQRLRCALWNNVFTSDIRAYGEYLHDRMEDFSTLLLGETGTGKGSAAAAIGRAGLTPFDARSGRFKYSFTTTFVAINLSQFPVGLIESELFGHRKGAFTGAIDHHKGLFERCSPHGALFLDEIGDVPAPVQIKLLNVLQERHFTPVGSHEPLRFDGRVVAATNRPLGELRARGQFRDDFYYRLCSDVIEVPPLRVRLRESPAELGQLVELLLERMTRRRGTELAGGVLAALRAHLPAGYPWPGNVRELEQAVRRIVLKGEYRGAIADVNGDWLEAARRGELSARALTASYCRMLYERHGTFEEVAARTGLDRRTARKYVLAGSEGGQRE